MNFELMNDHIQYFKREIIESGFKRDIDDYVSSLPNHVNNIITLRDIANNVLKILERIYNSDLQDALNSLLPSKDHRPFTETAYYNNLKEILDDTQIQLPAFYNKLLNYLTELKNQLKKDESALDKIKAFITPYIAEDVKFISQEGLATISIIFKEQQTITSLKNFTKAIRAWNRILPVYHQLLKSKSPEDIQIVQVQNGCIDFIVNMDVNVSLNLVELFKLGFEVFGAYLSYKQMIKPIIDSYHGNKTLISQEGEREKLLLDNIGIVVDSKIKEQHKEARTADKSIDDTSIDKKVEQVTKLITSHIVKGNDIKLLALPDKGQTKYTEEEFIEKTESLRSLSSDARRNLSLTQSETQQKLLAAYGKINEDTELNE